jgi:hypothetical protein
MDSVRQEKKIEVDLEEFSLVAAAMDQISTRHMRPVRSHSQA